MQLQQTRFVHRGWRDGTTSSSLALLMSPHTTFPRPNTPHPKTSHAALNALAGHTPCTCPSAFAQASGRSRAVDATINTGAGGANRRRGVSIGASAVQPAHAVGAAVCGASYSRF